MAPASGGGSLPYLPEGCGGAHGMSHSWHLPTHSSDDHRERTAAVTSGQTERSEALSLDMGDRQSSPFSVLQTLEGL